MWKRYMAIGVLGLFILVITAVYYMQRLMAREIKRSENIVTAQQHVPNDINKEIEEEKRKYLAKEEKPKDSQSLEAAHPVKKSSTTPASLKLVTKVYEKPAKDILLIQ